MAKVEKSVFICGECGYESAKWLGKCPACGSWNTLVEESTVAREKTTSHARAVPLSLIETTAHARVKTGIGELDRVLGGGIVAGGVTLLSGDPGIGKSTLLMQMASRLTERGKVLYVTGEESASQLKMRAERLGVTGDMLILAETDVNAVEAEFLRLKPDHLIIDSIQTMYTQDKSSAPGSVTQIRESAALLTRLAKQNDASLFLVGHVTKDGAIAGPRVLEHMVDTVLYFEGERNDAYRLLRGVKNRFGSTNEIGVFEMRDVGMTEVKDPSGLFLSGASAPGCAVTCAMEGTRAMLVEIQALLSDSQFNNPRRMTAGVDPNRLMLLLAVLEKKANLRLASKDVYINVVGGLRLEERASDLGVALAVASALLDKPIGAHTAILGEISLTGEIRAVSRIDKRAQECARLGFTEIIAPDMDGAVQGAKIIRVRDIGDAVGILLK